MSRKVITAISVAESIARMTGYNTPTAHIQRVVKKATGVVVDGRTVYSFKLAALKANTR